MSSPTDPPPIPPEFFPPGDPASAHDGIEKELRKTRFIDPRIKSKDDYRLAYSIGFLRARDFLFRLPAQPAQFGPRQIKLLHQLLYSGLYRDPGLWAEVPGTFGGRFGADPAAIEPEFALLVRQSSEITAGWRFPIESDDEFTERLALFAFYHARFLLVHPFRDGNGRVSRLIAQWQEWCIFGPDARQLVPRGVYMAALEALPHNLAPLLNFFGYRHTAPVRYIEEFAPPFPVRVTHHTE